MSNPVNSRKIKDILVEFMEEIEELEANVMGSPTQYDIDKCEEIYDRAVAKLDKEYFKHDETLEQAAFRKRAIDGSVEGHL